MTEEAEKRSRDETPFEQETVTKIRKVDVQLFDDLVSTFPKDWPDKLKHEFNKPYFKELIDILNFYCKRGKVIYPRYEDIFRCLHLCPFSNVRVVILGADPYHGQDQAEGLCFSVKKGIKIPPSLDNIFKELENDLKTEWKRPDHGSLVSWAEQGVLLLNSVLTVSAKEAGSHAEYGWEAFTDTIIETLNYERSNLVFLLWGSYAQAKGRKINKEKHLVLTAGHPSPLSEALFFGCNHFSKTNDYLSKHGLAPINWQT